MAATVKELTDKELAQKASSNGINSPEMDEFLRRFEPKIKAAVRRVTLRDPSVSEADAMQEARIDIVTNLPKTENITSIDGWIFKVSRNAALRVSKNKNPPPGGGRGDDDKKERPLNNQRSDPDVTPKVKAVEPSVVSNQQKDLETKERVALFKKAIASLEKDEQIIFSSWFRGDLDTFIRLSGMKPGTVYSKASRIRKKLSVWFAQHGKDYAREFEALSTKLMSHKFYGLKMHEGPKELAPS